MSNLYDKNYKKSREYSEQNIVLNKSVFFKFKPSLGKT